MNTVYIGYDPKEDTAYEVLKFTIERISGKNIRIVPLRRDILEHIGIYTRKSELMIKGLKKQYPKASKSVLQKAQYEQKKFKCAKS